MDKENYSGKKSHSIRWKVISMVAICWLIPIVLIIAMVAYVTITTHYDNLIEGFEKQIAYGNELSVERLNAAIAASRKASEDKVLRDASAAYLSGERAEYATFTATKKYLNQLYKRDDAFYQATYWLSDDPQQLNCSVYNLGTGGSYQYVQTYWNQDHETIEEFSKSLDTAVGFLNLDGRLYMVRNVMSSKFETIGVLVMRLNIQYCFGGFMQIPMEEAATIELNGQRVAVNGGQINHEEIGIDFKQSSSGGFRKYGAIYIYHGMKTSDYQLRTVMKMEPDKTNMTFYGYFTILTVMLVCLIPLFFITLRVFKKQVTEPVGDMLEGAKEIASGNMGYQLVTQPRNQEFEILYHSFNNMSETLKNQFERIYKKEIALRDARIMALQSHINPHFLNNTLEIINWEARLSGDVKVTKMIESLSTMLDAAIDRKKRPEIFLAEELNYTHAYLHITKARLGKRLEVVEEIPEEIMGCYVPRLILQPVVENAIEHGIIPSGSGTVCIKGWQEDEFLIIEVINDGDLTEQDEVKIKSLLGQEQSVDYDSLDNIGIANVNQRLKLFYGERSGLTIKKVGADKVAARLLFEISQKEQKNTINHSLGYSYLPENER